MATNTNADIGSSPYARRRRELFELIKALRDLGADADLGRPRIAVIGGQSAGKSSLVEAVTGITVPRDSGTCTRCPMECSIRGGTSSWSCQVSLMRANGIDGPRSVITTPFGERITDKGDVEISIRRAQAAILSPHRPPDAFLNKTYDELKEMLEQDTRTRSFSKDVVVVDIEDPDGTDLLFVDLPGLVQNANDSDIETVKGLVEEYIAEEKTIILVTIPASDDLENQQAIKLARQADPEGSRTVGVVTKPDALTAGATSARNKWQNILKGLDHKHALVLGYYCIRLPDDEERGKTRAEMQLIANEFLRTTQPWSGLHNTDRLGVPALVRDISDLLMGIIEESLPEILKKLQDRIRNCEDELATLPEPVRGDPATEILNRTTAFCQDLQAIVFGTSGDKSFVHRNRAVYLKFVLAIRRTAPNFQPYESLYHYRMRHFGDEQETVEQLVMPPMDLYEVRRVIQDSIAWELPRNIPYDAKVVLIKKFLELWPEPSLQCQTELYDIVREVVDAQITQHFKRFKRLENHIGPLVRNHAASVFEACTVAVNELVERESSLLLTQNNHYLDSVYWKWLNRYKCARRNPLNRSFTLPYSSHVAEGTESVLDADDLSCAGSPCSEMPVPESAYLYPAPRLASGSYRGEATRQRTPTEKALDALSAAGYANLTEADLARLHPPDAFEDEIGVMADVRAYFQVAYKRIIDHFPLTIQHAISQKLAKTMQAHLVDKLKLGAPDASQRFKDLLVEDPQLEVKREELLEQMKQLKDIRERLEQI